MESFDVVFFRFISATINIYPSLRFSSVTRRPFHTIYFICRLSMLVGLYSKFVKNLLLFSGPNNLRNH